MRAYLLRHGESRSNAAVDLVSLPEEEGDCLSPLGERQAKFAAERIAADLDVARIVCSPMARARQTAAPIAQLTGVEPEIWDWIHELEEPQGYEELPGPEQQRLRWSNRMREHADDPEHAPAGAESFATLVRRVERMRRQLALDAVDRTLIVGHGIFFRFVFALTLLGEDFTPAAIDRLWRIGSLNCGLSIFEHTSSAGSANPADIEGWRCVSWMIPTVPPMEVTGTGGGGAGN
ncbi:MAG: histidine phosphatase family protein [Solirubrobacterales bacterium]|nr:histidine phosphatase family protein [Solirubrobacterales bacterium]